MDYARPALVEALAAQYAAGTLRGPARRRFEALLRCHPGLQRAVAGWQQRLMPLTGAVPPVEPPPAVWRAIERRLWPAAAPQGWWQRLALWRGVSVAATVAALAFALLPALGPEPGAPVLVVLEGTGPAVPTRTSIVASLSADGRALVTRPLQPVGLPADRALELWAVPPQGAPRSLGVIAGNGTTVVPRQLLPRSLFGGDTAALAVTIEPPGGSPTGQATGPIVYVGKLQL